MSILDLDRLGSRNLIAQYVLECRNNGHFLPYDDYAIIEGWLALAPGTDDLLLILSDVLPDYYTKRADRSRPPSLSAVDRRIRKKLQERAKRHPMRMPSGKS